MDISRADIVEAFVQALGKEAAEDLIKRKIKEAKLPEKDTYDTKELERLVDELRKEGVLVRNLALIFLSQIRLKRLQEREM
jgi:hypothetical protein